MPVSEGPGSGRTAPAGPGIAPRAPPLRPPPCAGGPRSVRSSLSARTLRAGAAHGLHGPRLPAASRDRKPALGARERLFRDGQAPVAGALRARVRPVAAALGSGDRGIPGVRGSGVRIRAGQVLVRQRVLAAALLQAVLTVPLLCCPPSRRLGGPRARARAAGCGVPAPGVHAAEGAAAHLHAGACAPGRAHAHGVRRDARIPGGAVSHRGGRSEGSRTSSAAYTRPGPS